MSEGDDENDEDMAELDGRVLIGEVLIAGLIDILCESGQLMRDDLTAKILATERGRMLSHGRPDLVPALRQMLAKPKRP